MLIKYPWQRVEGSERSRPHQVVKNLDENHMQATKIMAYEIAVETNAEPQVGNVCAICIVLPHFLDQSVGT